MKEKKPKLRFRVLSRYEAYLVQRVRAAIIRAVQERRFLYEYTRRYHRKEWRPIQHQRLMECGHRLHDAGKALERFERVMSWGLARGSAARTLIVDLPPISPDALGDPWEIWKENVQLRAENAKMKKLIEAKMRVGFGQDVS